MTKFISGWRSEHADWLLLVGVIGVVYGTLPYGPGIIRSLYAGIGKDEFNSIVLFIGFFGIIVSLVYSSSLFGFSKGHIGRIALAAGILAYMAQFISIPAERLHFIEYALVGVAVERVLRPHIRDVGRPFVGMLCTYFVGMGDEIIQWLLSNRHGEIIDVFLNGWGGILGILLLPWPQQTLTSSSHRLLFLLITIAIVLSILFTFTTRDFGFMIVDEDKGFRFRSRLSPDDLREYDLEHGKRFGRILKQDIRLPYSQFLKKYPANRFPFVHEMRVHVFRRDRYARKEKASWIALRENQILESHFGWCLSEAGSAWPARKVGRIESRSESRDGLFYTSPVSSKVITTFSPFQFTMIAAVLVGCNALLFLITRRWLHVG